MDKEISNSVFSSVRQSWAHQADLEEPGDFVALVSRVRPQLDTEFNKIRFGICGTKCVSCGPGTQMFTTSTQSRKSKVLLTQTCVDSPELL